MKRFAKKATQTAAALVAAVCVAFLFSCEKKADPKPEPNLPEKEEAQAEYLLNGEDLSDYIIVIPSEPSDFEQWTCEILKDKVYELTGIELKTAYDSESQGELELLIGNTNREESRLDGIESGKYYLFSKNGSIVFKGEDYFVAGGAGYIISALESSDGSADISVGEETKGRNIEWKPARNVILFIGDGMGKNHPVLATAPTPSLQYSQNNIASPEEEHCPIFWAATFPYIGEAVTLNYYGSTTDSAAGATALATGYKTANGALGMIPADLDSDGNEDEFCSVQNVREAAALKGKSTAVLSTDKKTGATPNGFLVHHTSRYDRDIISQQQAALDSSRLDYTYFWSRYDNDEFLIKVQKTIDKCNNNDEGFFIMAEEAMIDKYSEKTDFDNVIRTVKRLNSAVAYTATYAACCPDTVVILTADHETGGLTQSDDGIWYWQSDGEHTPLNVPVYAIGHGCEIFGDVTVENTDIAKFIFSLMEN